MRSGHGPSIELLRHSGIRIEELAELSHHGLVRYQLPGAELIPLLHITPSKTDIERMLVISPELSEVLAVVIARVRGQGTGAVPWSRPTIRSSACGTRRRRCCCSAARARRTGHSAATT
jgi:hypothetical protein